MKNIIKDYQSITASRELKERVAEIMSKENKKTSSKKVFRIVGGCAACMILAGGIFLNMSPSTVYALSDIPVIGSIVKIVTFDRYTHTDGGYEADITTPSIEGLLDAELEKKLNDEFKENAGALIAAYEKDVKELKDEYGDETVHMGVTSDYIIKTNNDKILALDVYVLNAAGSSMTIHTYYTIDKQHNKQLTLDGLFKNGADYVTPISEYITEQMLYENEHNDGYFWVGDNTFGNEGFEKIAEDQKFYINDKDELVICFDKYEVAAGAGGSPEFAIPADVISDIYVGY